MRLLRHGVRHRRVPCLPRLAREPRHRRVQAVSEVPRHDHRGSRVGLMHYEPDWLDAEDRDRRIEDQEPTSAATSAAARRRAASPRSIIWPGLRARRNAGNQRIDDAGMERAWRECVAKAPKRPRPRRGAGPWSETIGRLMRRG